MRKLLLAFLLLPLCGNAMDKIAEVEHSSTSVILRFPLYDAASPADCASDITSSTSGLEINVSTDVSAGYYDQFRQSDSTLENITGTGAIGTYGTPSANKARLEIIASGACTYELQLPDAAFAVSNATILTIEVTDGTTEILDAVYWVDLTPVSQATLVDTLLDTSCSSYATSGDVGYQLCTVNNAILTDTGSTLNSTVNEIKSNTDFDILASGTAQSGSTTTLVDSALTEADDFYNDWSAIIVSGYPPRCVTDFASGGTVTFSPALPSAVTTDAYRIVQESACGPIKTADIAAIWAHICETQGSIACDDAMAYVLGALLGQNDYDGASTVTIKTPNGSATRATVTMGTDSGDRTNVSLNPP